MNTKIKANLGQKLFLYHKQNYTYIVILCQGRNQDGHDKDCPGEWNICQRRTLVILMTCIATMISTDGDFKKEYINKRIS